MFPTILVVDDDRGVRRALVDALRDADYAVDEASDGLMALKQIARQMSDLVLSDAHMPHLDGIELATTLAPHTPPIPLFLMTGNPLPYGCAQPRIASYHGW
jgi:CheY-like chemotaxis protein